MTAHAASHPLSPEDQYIASVVAHIPQATTLASQIAMDLRSHIAERLDAGQPIDEVVKQLGDPERLAESYLVAVPLVSATFGSRAIAKVIDFLVIGGSCIALGLVLAAVIFMADNGPTAYFVAPVMIFILSLGFPVYTAIAEYRDGYTIGKRLQGLRVVRESGARISFGQSCVRQLPWFLQFSFFDVLFALFTDKSQRAFEIISKTRVIQQRED
jgi:uncharacterized RDD family membrane protein YckC